MKRIILALAFIGLIPSPKAQAWLVIGGIPALLIDFKYELETGHWSDMPEACGHTSCIDNLFNECGWHTWAVVVTFPICLLGETGKVANSINDVANVMAENGYSQNDIQAVSAELNQLKSSLVAQRKALVINGGTLSGLQLSSTTKEVIRQMSK